MNATFLQFGLPGVPELLVIALIFVIPFALAYWTYTDGKSRGDENAAAWGISMFLFALFGLVPAIVALGLWTTVRPEKRSRREHDAETQTA